MRIVLVLLAFDFTLTRPPSGRSPSLSSYELQVSRSAQRGGMGKALMKCLYEIARGWKMQKVVLTVFKGEDMWTFFFEAFPHAQSWHFAENHAAFLFYKAMGFVRLLVDVYDVLIIHAKLRRPIGRGMG